MKSYPNNVVDDQLQNAHLESMVPIDMSRILVIYTGGTIGMISGRDGYLPVKNYLQKKLSQNARFHEPLQGDILKNLLHIINPAGSLQVKGITCDPVQVDALMTPYSLFHKRIRYSILEYEPLLDSSNMNMSDWIRIATDIEVNYELFDAFLVLHGTDTMAYTASALSFLLENLGKTVIITGSQVPLSEVRTDAIDNLLGALTIAGHFIIPEVGLFFDNKLLRGNRSSKVNAVDFNAFDSPNIRPLVNVGINIDVHWDTVFRPKKIAKFNAHKTLNPSVASLRIFPGITTETVRAFFSPTIAGVVLETYGSGNAPSNRLDLMQIIKEASERGVVIINCSQCKVARVEAIYETGVALFNIGVVPGADMTPECALTKLTYLLGKYPNSPQKVRDMMGRNLRGELTIVNRKQRFAYLPNLSHHTASQNMLVSSILSILGVATSPGAQIEADEQSATNLLDADKLDKSKTQAGLEARLIPLAFCHSARIGDVQTLEYLISEFDASINLSNEEGITPLLAAVKEGQLACVKLLLTAGANVHLRDRLGHSVLLESVLAGNREVMQILRRAGAHFSPDEMEHVTTIFIKSVVDGDLDRFKLFIDAGINPNVTFQDSRTALHIAATENRIDFVTYLTDLALADDMPPVMTRSYSGSSAEEQRLGLAIRVNLSPQDRWQKTPLIDAQVCKNDGIVSILETALNNLKI